MALLPPSSPVFKVHKHEPELITPAKPTPHEFKPLSDIDDQEGLRFQLPIVQIYENTAAMQGKDPVKVIREALAKALVFYYPLAGRLREGPNRKLVVECNGEGILFVEASADVKLEEFDGALYPPFPCFQEILFDVPDSSGMLNCPLLLVQVTRLKCGGFIMGLRLNHTMSDAFGTVQFLTAVAEMARGFLVPSISPVWERNILMANHPPLVTHKHHEFQELEGNCVPFADDNLSLRSFFFHHSKISNLRKLLPPHQRTCTSFELITACLWKCRTIALQIPDETQVLRMMCLMNARQKFSSLPIPEGYYGNAFAYPAAIATVGEVVKKPISYAVELVKKAKESMTAEYLRSVAALMVAKGRPCFTLAGTFIISDNRRAGWRDVDYGWGKALYGGIANAGTAGFAGVSYLMAFGEEKSGEDGIVVPVCLPKLAMERFAEELDKLLNHTTH